MIAELQRNLSAYFLCSLGVALLVVGCHKPNSNQEMEKMGEVLISASLLGFQSKRSPDGNTSTLQVTTPSPAMPPDLEIASPGK